MKMKLLLITLAAITVLVSASYSDYELDCLSMRSIDILLSFSEDLLRIYFIYVEAMPHIMQDLEEEISELGRNETRLLSQYHELKKGLNICKFGMQHDGNDLVDEFAANQTLLLVQIQNRKELNSTLPALSQVNTQILKLMEHKHKFQKTLLHAEQGIAINRHEIMQLQSTRHYLQQSQSESYPQDQRFVEDEFAGVASSSKIVGSSGNGALCCE